MRSNGSGGTTPPCFTYASFGYTAGQEGCASRRVFLRVSTDRQAEEGLGTDVQGSTGCKIGSVASACFRFRPGGETFASLANRQADTQLRVPGHFALNG